MPQPVWLHQKGGGYATARRRPNSNGYVSEFPRPSSDRECSLTQRFALGVGAVRRGPVGRGHLGHRGVHVVDLTLQRTFRRIAPAGNPADGAESMTMLMASRRWFHSLSEILLPRIRGSRPLASDRCYCGQLGQPTVRVQPS